MTAKPQWERDGESMMGKTVMADRDRAVVAGSTWTPRPRRRTIGR
jgi:hypothetical protein